MKNNECEVQIILKSGWVQSYRKVHGKGWIQTTNGIPRTLTAEQFLSHILPILAEGYQGYKQLKVIPDEKRKND
jgi:hypothetical protein